MNSRRILKAGESYTFSKYFELPFIIDDILAELNCTLERKNLTLPESSEVFDLRFLQQQLQRNLSHIDLVNETARREALIGPILFEVCNLTNQRLNIEYSIAVNDYLKGTLDYYIAAPQNLLVIEAKQSDLVRGFTQLAIELIALDEWTKSTSELLYGAVTTGEDWRFGVYHRANRQVTQDQKRYQVPEDLLLLVKILVGIINGCLLMVD
ncbi:hypothetical protein VF14_22445 [Nostoc linckia z18]|uniref:Uncharacterized protein n=2 Tax=Nostoc linckia TaxID=92942 RepID=A0A9Q6EMX3_NOSLI|nr:hypothetical protein [Nostoc linckia]PHK36370.1 hypothetical protein VF12_21410 [Nostoc linckia z15]PHK45810.1 hypothetical protein VF13_14160 [Nostoc linckia z16]PHJ64120.1 hypothetical protein VF02_13325 [Nostoc linckia z1]PHJ69753.1 hypothetical protein VF05_12540 [Nostoc linckia z3]PHJ75870.1 hypothetical protein VF03_08910 [Nostoc linckia z2]